ncbi:hypothetical protein E2C01_083497 [Portunus trituberculatus]|uniref:Uncharacterized protein n=1 Tax=Portunus trituberculatus TaxID=210409 RepID=A0A5B7J275_PORTR|nr:hypothetical protein [Portunus trituberculatus]
MSTRRLEHDRAHRSITPCVNTAALFVFALPVYFPRRGSSSRRGDGDGVSVVHIIYVAAAKSGRIDAGA